MIIDKREQNVELRLICYRIYLSATQRNGIRSELWNDKDGFIESADLSKINDTDLFDTVVYIEPVEQKIEQGGSHVYRDWTKKEVWYGRRQEIERVLIQGEY